MFGPTKRVLVNVKNFHPLASCIGSAKVFLSADSLQLPPRWMHAAPLHVSMISTWTQLHKIIMHNCQIRANILFQTYANIISTWNKILWTCACGGCCCIASHALKGSILFGQDLRRFLLLLSEFLSWVSVINGFVKAMERLPTKCRYVWTNCSIDAELEYYVSAVLRVYCIFSVHLMHIHLETWRNAVFRQKTQWYWKVQLTNLGVENERCCSMKGVSPMLMSLCVLAVLALQTCGTLWNGKPCRNAERIRF